MDAFYEYLASIGITASRAAIVRAIAEKVSATAVLASSRCSVGLAWLWPPGVCTRWVRCVRSVVCAGRTQVNVWIPGIFSEAECRE